MMNRKVWQQRSNSKSLTEDWPPPCVGLGGLPIKDQCSHKNDLVSGWQNFSTLSLLGPKSDNIRYSDVQHKRVHAHRIFTWTALYRFSINDVCQVDITTPTVPANPQVGFYCRLKLMIFERLFLACPLPFEIFEPDLQMSCIKSYVQVIIWLDQFQPPTHVPKCQFLQSMVHFIST